MSTFFSTFLQPCTALHFRILFGENSLFFTMAANTAARMRVSLTETSSIGSFLYRYRCFYMLQNNSEKNKRLSHTHSFFRCMWIKDAEAFYFLFVLRFYFPISMTLRRHLVLHELDDIRQQFGNSFPIFLVKNEHSLCMPNEMFFALVLTFHLIILTAYVYAVIHF